MASTPEPLPSLPPSPVAEPQVLRPEEDVGRAWHDDEPPTSGLNLRRKGKGKGKRRATRDEDEDEEEEEGVEEGGGAVGGYPPTKEEEAEARRVQEVRISVSSSMRRQQETMRVSPYPTPQPLQSPQRVVLCIYASTVPCSQCLTAVHVEPSSVGDRRTPATESRARVRLTHEASPGQCRK